MTGVELILLLLATYAAAAPDRYTLAATRGAVGATRAVVRSGRPSSGRARSATSSTSTRSSTSTKPARPAAVAVQAADPVDVLGPVRAVAAAAASGWRDGVQAARTRRAEGRDLVGRVRRAAGGTSRLAGSVYAAGQVYLAAPLSRLRSPRAARGDQAGADGAATPVAPTAPPTPAPATTTEAVDPAPPASPAPPAVPTTPPVPVPAETPREELSVPAMQTTELESLDAVQAEAQLASQAIAEVQDVLTSLQAWAAALPDRWSGTDWSTTDLDTAIAGIGDAVTPDVDPDELSGGLAMLTAAVERARAVAEVADQVGATGNVDRFRAS